LHRLNLSNYYYGSKKSKNGKIVYAIENPYVVTVYQLTDETVRVLNLVEATSKRIVIHAERKEVMIFFSHLLLLKKQGEKKISIQELARLLDFFFDFRKLNNPEKSIELQSIVTQLHNIQKEMEEETAIR